MNNPARMSLGRDGTALLYCSWKFRAVPRSAPGWTWDGVERRWTGPITNVGLIADGLRRAGLGLYATTGPDAPDPNRNNRTRPDPDENHGRTRPATDWVGAAFDAAPAGTAAKLRRGLLGAFHPDAGGDTVTAVRINQAADRRETRDERKAPE